MLRAIADDDTLRWPSQMVTLWAIADDDNLRWPSPMAIAIVVYRRPFFKKSADFHRRCRKKCFGQTIADGNHDGAETIGDVIVTH